MLFCVFFSRDQRFVSGFVCRLSLGGGLDFGGVEVAAEMRVT